ncbi:hypothetical protein QUF31_21410 [Dickeya chrysanthemi]|nr:hypothetical protein [Dickeya chrysanthemi]WJM87702.1 hypothetical protein QUF31_21410 [Dickeya chrysanthemi]
MRGQRGQHHRAGIGRGHEEDEADRHRHRDHRAAPLVALQQRIQHRLRGIDGLLRQCALAVMQQLVQCAIAEDLYEIGAGTSEIRRMLIGRELFERTA